MISRVQSVLAIGVVDVASLSSSAKRAGYRVYGVDYHGDQDLKRNCVASLSIMDQNKKNHKSIFEVFRTGELLRLAKELRRWNAIDATLLSSGLDDSYEFLIELHRINPILGNPPNLIRRVRDRMNFFAELERIGVPHPSTALVHDLLEAKTVARDLGFPLLIKPLEGFGGLRIRIVKDFEQLDGAFKLARTTNGEVLLQEYVPGFNASASVMSIPGKAQTLVINEQLLGISEVGQKEPFGYCGNIVPAMLPEHITKRCEEVSEKVVSHFGLIGTNGVDLVISKEGTPYVIEVNPRFQGTIECVEQVLRLNLVEAHVKACTRGELPVSIVKPERFCLRLILFAKHRLVTPDYSEIKECRDVPFPRTVVEEGEPICSIVTQDRQRDIVIEKAKQISNVVYSSALPPTR